jgi:hypothetical protein
MLAIYLSMSNLMDSSGAIAETTGNDSDGSCRWIEEWLAIYGLVHILKSIIIYRDKNREGPIRMICWWPDGTRGEIRKQGDRP